MLSLVIELRINLVRMYENGRIFELFQNLKSYRIFTIISLG